MAESWMAESFVWEVCALPRCCSGVSMTAGLRLSTLVSRLSAFSGKIMDGKIIAEDVAIQISYRFGISGVIDIILELIAPLIAVRIMTT
jgi:hypothetical protein